MNEVKKISNNKIRNKVAIHFSKRRKEIRIENLGGEGKRQVYSGGSSVILISSKRGERCLLCKNKEKPTKITGRFVEGYADISEYIKNEIGDELFVENNYHVEDVTFNHDIGMYVGRDKLKPLQSPEFLQLEVEVDIDVDDDDDHGEVYLTGTFYFKLKAPRPDTIVNENKDYLDDKTVNENNGFSEMDGDYILIETPDERHFNGEKLDESQGEERTHDDIDYEDDPEEY